MGEPVGTGAQGGGHPLARAPRRRRCRGAQPRLPLRSVRGAAAGEAAPGRQSSPSRPEPRRPQPRPQSQSTTMERDQLYLHLPQYMKKSN
jgi:hypothetical protein